MKLKKTIIAKQNNSNQETAICPKCSCGCKILSTRCLSDVHSKISEICIDEKPELRNSVDSFVLEGLGDICGCLSTECVEALCSAIIVAQNKANEHNDMNPSNNKSYMDYLEARWKALTTNKYFIRMYAHYLVYYYYELGYASSSTTPQGDMTGNRQGSQWSRGGTNISEKISVQKAKAEITLARGYASKFESWMKKNISNYPCMPTPKCDTCKQEVCQCRSCVERPRATII